MTLRRVLHAFRDGWLLEERMDATARGAADDARRQALPAAALLDALDQAWDAMPEVRAFPEPVARRLRARLASACVRAYYAERRGTSPSIAENVRSA